MATPVTKKEEEGPVGEEKAQESKAESGLVNGATSPNASKTDKSTPDSTKPVGTQTQAQPDSVPPAQVAGPTPTPEPNNNTPAPAQPKVITLLKDPGVEYWRQRSPLADKIVITDVTVNLQTVTFRECKVETGFFKTRSDLENGVSDVNSK
ncbi:polycomb group protein Pc-like [Diaphorina citri]|uniref:Polycomb group protein Pc-like n=1 Tax=Diaphorina citri TaxID=121845 RepID=A0A1S3D8B0_DIACI|nr:polycomb group protein Pc-like [Diaphorina citri]